MPICQVRQVRQDFHFHVKKNCSENLGGASAPLAPPQLCTCSRFWAIFGQFFVCQVHENFHFHVKKTVLKTWGCFSTISTPSATRLPLTQHPLSIYLNIIKWKYKTARNWFTPDTQGMISPITAHPPTHPTHSHGKKYVLWTAKK